MPFEHWHHFGLTSGGEPLQPRGQRRMPHGRVAPAVSIPRRGRSFDVGVPYSSQPMCCATRRVTALEHAVQRGQVLGVLDAAPRAAQDAFDVDTGQRFQPQLLRLIQLRGILEGFVVLVVIVQAKQREDLIDRVDPGVLWFSRPSCGL